MKLEPALFDLTLLLYLIASLAYHAHVFTGSEPARRAALAAVALAVPVHTAAIGAWCLAHGALLRDPGMPFSLVAYFLALVQVGANYRRSWASIGALTMPLAFVAHFTARVQSPGGGIPDTGSPLLRPHVLVLLLGFAAFALAFCLAVTYLVQSRLLKAKQVRGLVRRLPPLESVATAAHWMATLGFSMLTLGVVSGAIVAPQSWGPGWYLDPRTVTSVVAWLIYAAYLGVSTLLGWRGRRTTYFLIAGFLVVLVAFVASVARPRPGTATAPVRAEVLPWC